MTRVLTIVAATVVAALVGDSYMVARAQDQAKTMSFFITSAGSGNGGNLGGLTGADAHCAALAKAVGAGNRQWRAYLSTSGAGGVNAKDRIGAGPWFNSKGVQIAANVAELHSDKNNLTKETQLTEKGAIVNGRGDKPNTHDILTGSNMDGTATENTCSNWTSAASDVNGMVGHHDRDGGGTNPKSWNSAHSSKGCSQENLVATGGAGLYYCFAAK